ncbi:MAG TPA: hypothetical protein VNC61_16195 [Acidimicrobiales bacterium]|nr:hypothetical protein [Acidimicrobiales bacterium]
MAPNGIGRVSKAAIVAIAGFSLVVGLTGCSSGPAGPKTARPATYGPAGHRFSVAFPSAPIREVDTGSLSGGLPPGSKTYGYQVSSESDIFSNSAAVPPAPAYGVAIAATTSGSFASLLSNGLVHELKAGAVTVNGRSGFEKVGPERSFPSQSKTADPNASEGLLIVRRASTVFLVLAVTTQPATTRAFLASFRAS